LFNISVIGYKIIIEAKFIQYIQGGFSLNQYQNIS